MKKIQQLLCVGVIFIFVFSSCTIEKRRYLPGYDIQWNHPKPVTKKNEPVPEIISCRKELAIPVERITIYPVDYRETLSASADLAKIRSHHIKKTISPSSPCCAGGMRCNYFEKW